MANFNPGEIELLPTEKIIGVRFIGNRQVGNIKFACVLYPGSAFFIAG